MGADTESSMTVDDSIDVYERKDGAKMATKEFGGDLGNSLGNQESGHGEEGNGNVPAPSTDDLLDALIATEAFEAQENLLFRAWERGVLDDQELIAAIADLLVPRVSAAELDPRYQVTEEHLATVEEYYARARSEVLGFDGLISEASAAVTEQEINWLRHQIGRWFPHSTDPVTESEVRTIMSRAHGEHAPVTDALEIAAKKHHKHERIHNPVAFVITLLKQPHGELAREAARIRWERDALLNSDSLGQSEPAPSAPTRAESSARQQHPPESAAGGNHAHPEDK